MSAVPPLSVILPAHDEASYIGACLSALLGSDDAEGRLHGAEVIVVANGCRDGTAQVARGFAPDAAARGWTLTVLDLPRGGKMGALNAGDAAARGAVRVYLDADVAVSPPLLSRLAAALDTSLPRYASGRPRVTPASTAVTRAYARFWSGLPFLTHGVPGFGIFAVNAAGRARWGVFPDIISDDTFVRLHFAPSERLLVDADYSWPMVEGFSRLVRVRRRQDRGVAQIARRFPALAGNDDKPADDRRRKLRRILRDPLGFAVYGAVALAVRLRPGTDTWARGR